MLLRLFEAEGGGKMKALLITISHGWAFSLFLLHSLKTGQATRNRTDDLGNQLRIANVSSMGPAEGLKMKANRAPHTHAFISNFIFYKMKAKERGRYSIFWKNHALLYIQQGQFTHPLGTVHTETAILTKKKEIATNWPQPVFHNEICNTSTWELIHILPC